MMILIVLAVIAIVLFVSAFLVNHLGNCYSDVPWLLRAFAIIFIVLSVCFAIPAFFVNQCAESSTTTYRIQYETLVYQLENGAYENVVEYNRKDLMDDICDYNSHVESGRILSKNAWIGVYYPEDWDNLPLIELENYK